MPNIEFLENFPLYRKFEFKLPSYIREIKDVNINMYCPNCEETRTFRFSHKYLHKEKPSIRGFGNQPIYPPNPLVENEIIHLNYICASCEKFNRMFSIRIGKNRQYIEKIGQFPPWDISIKKKLRRIFGVYSDYYKKGLICESQSSGIGANIYYRRIVEEIIGELLEDIKEFLVGEDRDKYEKTLEETRKSKNAQDKINLVKNLIPPILMVGSQNPLKVLYNILSGGIHGKTDEDCLEDAQIIRETLIFLINIILGRKKEKQKYDDNIKKLLEKRRQKQKKNN